MKDIFVVSNDRRNFETLLHEARVPWDFEITHRMVHYVMEARELEGIHNARVVVCGSYFKRPDWPLIEEIIERNGLKMLKVR